MKIIAIFLLLTPVYIFPLTYGSYGSSTDDLRAYFLDLVNQYRISNNLFPFECVFNEIPQKFTDFQMKIGIFLGHIGFSNRAKEIRKMIEKTYGLQITNFVVAENVAYVKGDDLLNRAFKGFLKSWSHKNNILSSKYKWTAIGISKSENKLYICQMFWDFK